MCLEFENTRAVRTVTWKYVQRFPSGPHELYDLAADPGEETNLIGRAPHAATQQMLARRLDAFFDRHADPAYDLKNGGRSKTPLLLQPTDNR